MEKKRAIVHFQLDKECLAILGRVGVIDLRDYRFKTKASKFVNECIKRAILNNLDIYNATDNDIKKAYILFQVSRNNREIERLNDEINILSGFAKNL